jgi:hypothetical protein
VSEGFGHCFERDVTEDEITLGPIRMWLAVGPISIRVRGLRTATERAAVIQEAPRPAAVWQTRSVSEQTPTNSDFIDIWSAGTNPSPWAWNRGRQWAHDQRKHFESDRHRLG